MGGAGAGRPAGRLPAPAAVRGARHRHRRRHPPARGSRRPPGAAPHQREAERWHRRTEKGGHGELLTPAGPAAPGPGFAAARRLPRAAPTFHRGEHKTHHLSGAKRRGAERDGQGGGEGRRDGPGPRREPPPLPPPPPQQQQPPPPPASGEPRRAAIPRPI